MSLEKFVRYFLGKIGRHFFLKVFSLLNTIIWFAGGWILSFNGCSDHFPRWPPGVQFKFTFSTPGSRFSVHKWSTKVVEHKITFHLAYACGYAINLFEEIN